MRKIILIIGFIISLKSIWAEEKKNVETPMGSPVTAWIMDEMPASTIAEAEAKVKTDYPNAEIISAASNTYNCHGYAWHMTEGGDARWIGLHSDTDEDVYMTDGSYIQVVSGVGPLKVSYVSDNHSAVTTDESGMFISKWGNLPLMRHASNYCYYNSADLRYFVRSSLMTINGSGTISANAGNQTYTLSYTPAGTIEWTVPSCLRIVSGQGTASITVAPNGMGNGYIYATMTHEYAGETVKVMKQKAVEVGTPDVDMIEISIGGSLTNYTLSIYNSGRNECKAIYRGAGGNNSILEYEWQATGFEVHNVQTTNKSIVYLRAIVTSVSSPTTVSIRARNEAGWSGKKLVGANIDTSSGYSILTSSDGIITIEPNEGREYSLLRPTERTLSGSMPYEVYNSYTGVQVANGAVSREGSTINLSHLPTGIYVFSLRVSDDLRQTLQISIRH